MSAKVESLTSVIVPGDIVFVKGNGRFQTIGANGGFMGHVMIALAPPVRVDFDSPMAKTLAPLWPAGACCLWRLHTAESTRSASGLHQAEMLLYVDACSRMYLVGELSLDHSDLARVDMEALQIWQSPRPLREQMNSDLVAAVLSEMHACQGQWSYATAARALLLSGGRCDSKEKPALLHEAKACWKSAPICTTVVIVFWQRYLCKYAKQQGIGADPADLIRKWMPLKADRTLPGTLQQVLRECQWKIRDRAPQYIGI